MAPAGKDAKKPAASTGSNSTKSTSDSSSSAKEAAASAKKQSLKPGDPAAKKPSLKPGDPVPPPAVLLWPDGKPILGSDGKPIDPATLTIVVEKDGKSIVHGPDGKPFLLPDGKPLDPALVPPKEGPPPQPPPKPYVGAPPPRFLRPPWEKKPPPKGPIAPRFIPYHPLLMEALKLKLPPQVEFQDGEWDRTMLNIKRAYPKLVRLHLGHVEVNFEKHAGPFQCFIEVLVRDIPEYPDLVGKPQFSTCNFFIR